SRAEKSSCSARSRARRRFRSSWSQNCRWPCCTQIRVRRISSLISSRQRCALSRNTIRLARKLSSASIDETCACSLMPSTLVEILLDPLRFPHEIRSLRLGNFRKLSQHFHRGNKFLCELFVLLVLPRAAERIEARLKCRGAHLHIVIEAFELFRKAADLF